MKDTTATICRECQDTGTRSASRIDYCNSILYCVAAVHLRPLQSVLNSFCSCASLIVSRSQRRFVMSYTDYQFTNESSTNCASLRSSVYTSRPQHSCSPLSSVTTRRQLRAATQGDLDYPRTRTVMYGSRAFAVSAPTCWNLLPSSVKSPSLKPLMFVNS